VDFDVCAGEIVGISGMVGSGRTTLARALAGLTSHETGTIDIAGRGAPRSPTDAIAKGLILVPEDRKREGLVLDRSVAFNLSLPILGAVSRIGFVDRPEESRRVSRLIDEFDVRPADPAREVGQLSGGNQQKVVIAKCLGTEPSVLVVDEPTRGIDVAAKAELHGLLRTLAVRGVAILMISSDLPELLGMSDRVLVMRDGRLVGEMAGKDATELQVMSLAAGGAA
jgi:rhamnose transport system ATP-binding protein